MFCTLVRFLLFTKVGNLSKLKQLLNRFVAVLRELMSSVAGTSVRVLHPLKQERADVTFDGLPINFTDVREPQPKKVKSRLTAFVTFNGGGFIKL